VLKQMGRSRRVALGVPEFGLMPRSLLGSNLLCVVPEALVEALMATGYGPRIAADPPPFPCPDSVIRMAWRTALDHDPGEVWLHGQLIQWLTRLG
jgi:LysR family transcriptional activator of mexEF-oprN operon